MDKIETSERKTVGGELKPTLLRRGRWEIFMQENRVCN
jgi:hypothetical protein